MMTFKEAKAEADKIGGVVNWWWTYSVYSAEEWASFNGTMGYGKYFSKAALKFFKDKYKTYKLEKEKQKREILAAYQKGGNNLN